MREILFRGKAFDNGWVEGLLVWVDHNDETALIRTIGKDGVGYFDFLVDFETVGQYTGLTDKNGKKIFEGDIVEYPIESGGYKGENIHEVVFENRHGTAYFGIKMSNIETWGFDMEVPSKLMKVIGNIHDNPELLEVSE